MSSIEGSGFAHIRRLFHFRITPDADLLQAISEAVSAEGIRAGVFVSGLEALKKAIFRNLKVFPIMMKRPNPPIFSSGRKAGCSRKCRFLAQPIADFNCSAA